MKDHTTAQMRKMGVSLKSDDIYAYFERNGEIVMLFPSENGGIAIVPLSDKRLTRMSLTNIYRTAKSK